MPGSKCSGKAYAIHDAKIRDAMLVRNIDASKPDRLYVVQLELNTGKPGERIKRRARIEAGRQHSSANGKRGECSKKTR